MNPIKEWSSNYSARQLNAYHKKKFGLPWILPVFFRVKSFFQFMIFSGLATLWSLLASTGGDCPAKQRASVSLSRQEMEVNKWQIHDFFLVLLLTLQFKKGSAMRLCSTWWDAEGELTPESVDEILLGLSSQISEREDPVLCSDVRNNLFGPMEFSR